MRLLIMRLLVVNSDADSDYRCDMRRAAVCTTIHQNHEISETRWNMPVPAWNHTKERRDDEPTTTQLF
jgi:hypothetical protein